MNNNLFIFIALSLPLMTKQVNTSQKGLFSGLFLALFFFSKELPFLFMVPVTAALCIFFSRLKKTESEIINRTATVSHGPALPLFLFFVVSMVAVSAMSSSAVHFLDKPFLLIWGGIGAVSFGIICDRKGAYIAALYLIFLQAVFVCLTSANAVSYSPLISSALASFCTGGLFTVLPMISNLYQCHHPSVKTNLIQLFLVFPLWTLISFACHKAQGSLLSSGDFLSGLLILSALSITFLWASWKKRLFLVTSRRFRRGHTPL